MAYRAVHESINQDVLVVELLEEGDHPVGHEAFFWVQDIVRLR